MLPKCSKRVFFSTSGIRVTGLETHDIKDINYIMRTQDVILRCSKMDKEVTPEECVKCGGSKELQSKLSNCLKLQLAGPESS